MQKANAVWLRLADTQQEALPPQEVLPQEVLMDKPQEALTEQQRTTLIKLAPKLNGPMQNVPRTPASYQLTLPRKT